MDAARVAMVAGAAFAAGAVNAIAGGGSLITFPTLVAAGLPKVLASATNTVALCPGYLGGMLAQRRDLRGQGGRMMALLPIAAVGGAAGALLLMHTSARAFDVIVPFLLLVAAILVGAQGWLRARIASRVPARHATAVAAVPVAAAAVYGGYFGAGMGVMMVAALGIALGEELVRLNALKQAVTLTTNVTAALVFAIWGDVDWTATVAMAGAALLGGALGGAIATRVPQGVLRVAIVVLGVGLSVVYFARL